MPIKFDDDKMHRLADVMAAVIAESAHAISVGHPVKTLVAQMTDEIVVVIAVLGRGITLDRDKLNAVDRRFVEAGKPLYAETMQLIEAVNKEALKRQLPIPERIGFTNADGDLIGGFGQPPR